MTADIAELGFKVDTSDIDHAIKKFGLLDREFGKVEKSGGLVSRSFESVGEAGKKSGGLVSRAFREASQDLDKTLRSVAKLIPMLKAAASEMGDFANKYRRVENLSSIDINVKLDTKRAIKDIAELKAIAKSTTISIDARINDRASGALASTTAAVYSLTTAVAIGLAPLKAYSHELAQLAQNAKDAARALTGTAGAAGRGISGNVPSSAGRGDESALRKHASAVYGVTQRYAGLATQLLIVKSAMATLTATVVSAIPVLTKMATVAGAAFGTVLATANVNAATKEMQKLTETTGASAEGLQKWRLAARFEGVGAALNEFGDMGAVFSDLSSQMDKLGTESGKDFADGLKMIGLNAKQIKDMKPEDALLKIGEAIAKSNMSTRDKTAFLGAISSDAAKLLPLMEKVGQKFNEINSYAGKVGAIQSDAQLAAAKEANTQLSYFKVGLEGVQTRLSAIGNRVINTLGPNIKQLFIDAKGPIDDWALSVDIVLTKFKHDLDSTGSWGTAFSRMFEGMYPTLHQFLSSAGKFGKGYGEAFIAPMMDALKRGYASIGEALSAAGGAESLGAGLGAAMLPVVTIVETVVGGIKLLIENWDALKAVAAVTPVGLLAANWDPIVAVFESVGNGIRGIGEAFGLLNPATTANATGVQVFVAALGALLVSGAASRLVLGAIGATFNTLSFALAPLGAVLGIVATGLKAVALAAMANPIGALITVIAMGAALIFTNWSKVGEFFTGLWAGVKNSFSGLIDWWNNTTPKQKVLDIKAATIDVAREKYTQFVSWLDNTTPKQKVIDIATGSVSIAQKAVDLFIARWNESLIRSWMLDVETDALDYAEQKANEFSSWWESWTLKEVVADVTYETLVWAWEKGKEFSAWWNSWSLPVRNADVEYGMLEYAYDLGKRFANWWNTLSLKPIIPQIQMPNLPSVSGLGKELGAGLKNVAKDGLAGLAEGFRRFTGHIQASKEAAGQVEGAMRERLDTHSPSKITEAIGADTAAGLGLGIEKGGKGVKTAAAKTAQAATDAFKSIMEGLNKQLLSFTANDEVARRYELTQQKITGSNQDVVIATEAKIKAFEDERKKTEEAKATAESAAKTYADLVSGLKGQIVTLTQGDEAGRRYDLTQQKIAGSNQDVAISLQNQIKALEVQKTVKEDLARVNVEALSLDAQMAALKAGGVAAMDAEATRQSALNDLKEKGISVESALGQQYLTAKAAIEAKNKALEAEQDIQKNLQGIRDLNAEIAATKLGSAALAEANLQREIRNKLDALGLTQESALGQRIAETTRQLAAKNKELQIEQTLRGLRTENAWLEKEIAATQQGEKALKALNIQKRISEELDRQGIAVGTQAAAQITSMIQQQEGLKEKLASIQELRQPISQFFNDVLSGGKNAFKNLGDYILNWLKKMIVEFATNKLMLSIGMDGGLGGISSLLSGSGGLFSSITGLVTKGLGGLGTALSGGLSGIMSSIGGFVSAIPGWGWALAGVAAIASKFIGPSDPKARFTQGATTGQSMLGQGGYGNNPHNYQTAFGQIGFTAASDHIGRQKGFVEAAHKMMQSMVVLDAMIAKTLPNSIGKISDALKGLETAGFSTAEMMKQRYVTIAKSLSTDLQAALANGKDLTAMSAEEIAARFAYMAQVAESGLIPALEQLGLAGTQSKESMIAFAMSLSDALGGIDAAKAALDNYYQAAYTEAERLALTQSAAKTKLDEYNKGLGLSGTQYIDTIAELRAYIEAQDKNTEAGQKAIAAALGMVDALKILGGTAEEAAQKIKGQWADFNDAAYTDAQKQQIAQNQAKKAIDAFNQSLGLTGNKTIDNIIELRAYMRTLDGSTEAGRKAQQAALGMTSAFVAFGGTAEQIKQKIAGLRESIKGLVTNLYSSGSSSLTSTSSSTADSNQAALSAAQASLDSLRSQLNSEQDRISEVNNQAKEAYQNQLDYYRTLKDAAESLRNVANGFADDARSAADVLKSAQLDYNRTLQAAKSGDVEAAKKLGDMATRLKSAVSVAYNNDGRAASAIQQIEDQLRSTAGVLDGLAGSQPNDPGTITSTLIASLQSQISAQESVVSSLQSIASNASSSTNEAKATADRAAMAKELATKIGELGLATDKSAWQILTANGINIKDLAKDFGINVNKLDATFIKNTADLATRLNVNSLDLLTRLNVNFADLAKSFNIDVNNLNNGTLGKLDKLADQLHVSSVDLAAKLGINIDQLGDLMANKLAALQNIPADIKAGLAPHLQDIRNAADPATLQRELKELQAYVNTLPPGIRAQLNGQLDGILGYTGDTKTNTNDTKNETMALRNVSSRITDLTLYTRDELTGQYITKMLQNSRALNQNAANIGKSAVPSFAIGSDKLPSDMLANVHRGEMIFTAAQSNSMRDLAIYNQSVIPQIASYLSEIAANDSQAPVFIQPVINHPRNVVNNGSGRDELLEEVKGLRQDNKELKKEVADFKRESASYNYAIANSVDKLRRTNEKWDVDGLPLERTA